MGQCTESTCGQHPVARGQGRAPTAGQNSAGTVRLTGCGQGQQLLTPLLLGVTAGGQEAATQLRAGPASEPTSSPCRGQGIVCVGLGWKEADGIEIQT